MAYTDTKIGSPESLMYSFISLSNKLIVLSFTRQGA